MPFNDLDSFLKSQGGGNSKQQQTPAPAAATPAQQSGIGTLDDFLSNSNKQPAAASSTPATKAAPAAPALQSHLSDDLPSWLSFAKPVADFAEGGADEGMKQMARALSMLPGSAGQYFKSASDSLEADPNMQPKQNTASSIGKNALDALEYVSPVGRAEAVGAKLSPLAGKLAAGAASGAVSKLQGDSNANAAANAALPMFAPFAAKYAGKALAGLLGAETGAGPKAIERAFQNPNSSGLVAAMRGDVGEGDVLDNLVNKVTDFRNNASKDYRQKLANIAQSTVDPQDAAAHVNSLSDLFDNQLAEHRIGVQPNGDLDFRYSTMSPDEQQKVMALGDKLRGWGTRPEDYDPLSLDSLKQSIGNSVGEGGQLGAFSKPIYDQAKAGLNGLIPGYSDMTSNYAKAQDLLNNLKDLSVTASGAKSEGTATRKLSTLLRQNNGFREGVVNQLPGGSDILDQIAGLHLNSIAPHGLAKYLASGEAFEALKHGNLPAAALSVAASSPRLVGETSRLAGKVASSAPARNLSLPALQLLNSRVLGTSD